jgi:hypothetical protein
MEADGLIKPAKAATVIMPAGARVTQDGAVQ